ncbi:EKA-like protein [Blumeria hordei DH14]|uniref:EKA-like protein n=1 Tax=Blumeria graminis f. sp. hordei (strain DH14) TaxID=546991 RepID=N1JDR6_BLUG1|nr:EKA-like protein [Blumeria hordei DH14]
MRVYLRAAIAQYMATGSASTPPVFHPRPANPFLRAPDARSIPIPAVQVLLIKSAWATVARNGLRQNAVPIAKAVPRPAAKAQKNEAPKAKVDKRLFLRLEKEHPWWYLSNNIVKSKVADTLKLSHDKITSIHRVKTGFVMLAKKEKNATRDARWLFEASSDLVAS